MPCGIDGLFTVLVVVAVEDCGVADEIVAFTSLHVDINFTETAPSPSRIIRR
jgi:hypothetical protein